MNSVGYIYLTARQLVELINGALGENKYSSSTILNVFEEENICWNITDINDSTSTATIRFIGNTESDLYGKTITAPVLSTETDIRSTIYAIQVYADKVFTISESARSYFTATGEAITIDLESYKDTLSYFEAGSGSTKFYNKDKFRYVTLNDEQFNAYNYYISVGASVITALSNVITKFNITSYEIGSSITLSSGYVFFYYNKIPNYETHAIVEVCDQFIYKNGSALTFYPTSNQFAFTNSSVGSSIIKEGEENITEVISINIYNRQLLVNYQTGSTNSTNGTVYGYNNVKFALLSGSQIFNYINSDSRIEYLLTNLTSLTINSDGRFGKIYNDSIIIAYIIDANDNIITIAQTFVFINARDNTYRIVYDTDLMFFDIQGQNNISISNGILQYNSINKNNMLSGKLDTTNGIVDVTQKDNVKLYYAVMPANTFNDIATEIYYGLTSSREILTKYLLGQENNGISILNNSSQSIDLSSFASNHSVCYLIAFYSDSDTLSDATLLYFSSNFIKIELTGYNNSAHEFTNKFDFESLFIGTTYDVDDENFTVSFDMSKLNYNLFDYSTNTLIDNDVKLVAVSSDEIDLIIDIYKKANSTEGYKFVFSSTSEGTSGFEYTIKNISLEQTTEYVLYVLRNNNTNVHRAILNYFNSEGAPESISGSKIHELIMSSNVANLSFINQSLNVQDEVGTDGGVLILIFDEVNSEQILRLSTNFITYDVIASEKLQNEIVTSIKKFSDTINKN